MLLTRICVLFTAIFTTALSSAATTLSTEAWFTSSYHPEEPYPEQSDPMLQKKKNVGIAFSGGGTRSYLCSLGYLRGLHDLGLLKNVKYMSGVSGGAWATVVYSYYQKQKTTKARPVAQSDEELLGDIIEPEMCTFDTLNKMSKTSARYSATASLNEDLVANFLRYKSIPEAWIHQVAAQFIERYGIDMDDSFTWNASSLQNILDRNPTLTSDQFVLPSTPDRPYPIFVGTHEGPIKGAPFPEHQRTFSGFDFTPLYVGARELRNRTWAKYGGGPPITQLMGGVVEPFAFGSAAPSTGLHEPHGLLNVPISSSGKLFSLNSAIALSSYFLGGAVTTLGPLPFRRADKLGMVIPTFPVAGEHVPTTTDMVFSDGGCVIQPDLIGLIKRNVTSIILFLNLEIPLTGRNKWNPLNRPPSGSDHEVDDDFPAFFGLRNNDTSQMGYDLHNNQVFKQHEFAQVAYDMQTSQLNGNGCIATSTHTTIANDFWNVKAGFTVNVTWVYLSRAYNWEKKLPTDVHAMFPTAEDPTQLPTNLPFLQLEYTNFPNFITFTQLQFFDGSANLLSNLCGWVIKANKEIFQAVLGD